jgi:NEDD8-activating enzyme E1 regulatory subunit
VSYVRIKNAYNEQAAADYLKFKELLSNLGHQGDEEEQKLFLKNWFCLLAFKYRSLAEELQAVNKGDWMHEGEELHGWYFIFRATDKFRLQQNRDPEPKDFAALKSLVNQMLESNSIVPEQEFTVEDKLIHEMCRGANSHIVTICSVLGGIASQEIIKLITRQFSPVQNTLVFEGNRAHGAVGEF